MKRILFCLLLITGATAYAQQIVYIDAITNCMGPNGGNQYNHVKVKKGVPYQVEIRDGRAYFNKNDMAEMINVGLMYVNSSRKMVITTVERGKKTTVTSAGNLYFFFVDDAALNVGGVNVSIEEVINAPQEPVVVTPPVVTVETTVVTRQEQEQRPQAANDGCSGPMNAGNFESAKKSISSKSFAEEKMTICKQIIRANCFSVQQVIGLMKLFVYEENKLDVAKLAYPKTFDKGNYYLINNALTYSASVDELNKFLESQQ